jgi:DNA-binding transcriptional LysR family regulator
MDWDDVRIFLAVARAGSLRAAARDIALSQPTLGRRLARLEATLGGPPLFDRLPDGLRLTASGADLLPLAERVEATALTLQRRQAAAEAHGPVRISCGEWAGGFLATHLTAGLAERGLAAELVQSDQTANLARRAADLAVRHGRPVTGDLAVARIGTIACAIYQAADPAPPPGAWVTYTDDQSHYAAARWTAAEQARQGGHIAFRASTLALQLAAIRRGAGMGVVPCYLGEADPSLRRMGGRIAALDAPHWLIVHRDLRRLPAIRAMMQVITASFATHRALLEGPTAG